MTVSYLFAKEKQSYIIYTQTTRMIFETERGREKVRLVRILQATPTLQQHRGTTISLYTRHYTVLFLFVY